MGTIEQKATIIRRNNKPVVKVKKLNLAGLLKKHGKKQTKTVL